MEIQSLEQLVSNTFPNVTRITISAQLKSFPKELFKYTETLEILDLSDNLLSEVPDEIVQFKKLKILFLSNNQFTVFPLILGQCRKLSMIGFKSNSIGFIPEHAFPETLQWLILTNNCVENIPVSISKCLPLEKVALAGNKLSSLPIEMADCKNLALLRISVNNFKELPEWLLSMPKLAWLAYSGNPCAYKKTASKKLPVINWDNISVMEKLGEGASGIISKAKITAGNAGRDNEYVAVKVFKGEVTSDGYPEDEIHISACLPQHKNLVKVLGKLHNHPEKKEGLVFELIPVEYKNLGMPPSFATCSRDTFKEGTIFTLKEIVKILRSVAGATQQLHIKGIMHGDLYAHNTLIDDKANTLFGDFGAATAYDLSLDTAKTLQRIEARAFGYMIDDLLNYVDHETKNSEAMHLLVELKRICLVDEILLRPDFNHIMQSLEKII
ncbi:MAG: leucine-rich repeat-containing protein kinase family protein [Bacteroidota bacterium]